MSANHKMKNSSNFSHHLINLGQKTFSFLYFQCQELEFKNVVIDYIVCNEKRYPSPLAFLKKVIFERT